LSRPDERTQQIVVQQVVDAQQQVVNAQQQQPDFLKCQQTQRLCIFEQEYNEGQQQQLPEHQRGGWELMVDLLFGFD